MTQNLKPKRIFYILLFLSSVLHSQISTISVNSSKKQGAISNCQVNPCNYAWTTGNEIVFENNSNGDQIKNARYFFDHPGFKNQDIKKIVLELRINKIKEAPVDDFVYMYIRMPKNSCNSSIPWGAIGSQEKELYECNKYGNSIFQQGIGTNSTSYETFDLLIYDHESTGFTSETIQHFDPESESFTFSFHPFTGGIGIFSAKVHITYDSSNELPNTPSLTATATSSSRIDLNWTNINNASSYEVFSCDTNQLVATVSSNTYSVTGLASNTRYGYKVRAINSNGASNFSSCKYATTGSGNGGGCLPMSHIKPSRPIVSEYQGNLKVQWSSISQADGYILTPCNENMQLENTSGTEAIIEKRFLQPGESYSYQIIAKDQCNNGGGYYSQLSDCSTTYNIPCKSDVLAAINWSIGNGFARIYWDEITPIGNYKYEVFDCLTNEMLVSSYQTTYTFVTEPGTYYSFKVRTNGCSPSDFTECIEFTTPGCKKDLIIENKTISTSETYETSNSIEILESTFESSSIITANAGNFIILKSGTHFKPGSDAYLKIQECNSESSRSNLSSKNSHFDSAEDNNPNILNTYQFKITEKATDINLFPNPSNDYVSVNLRQEFLGGQITLMNLSNKILWKKDVINSLVETIDLKSISTGLYILRVNNNDKTIYLKLIKK